jgi:hypothetical protein
MTQSTELILVYKLNLKYIDLFNEKQRKHLCPYAVQYSY